MTYRIVKAVLRIVVFAFKQAQTGGIAVQLYFLLDTFITGSESLHFGVVQNSLVNVLAASCGSVTAHQLRNKPLFRDDDVHKVCVKGVLGNVVVNAYLAELVALPYDTTVALLYVCWTYLTEHRDNRYFDKQ